MAVRARKEPKVPQDIQARKEQWVLQEQVQQDKKVNLVQLVIQEHQDN